MIVVWRITQRCNLFCRFCSYDCDVSRPRADADPLRVMAFGSVLSEYQRTTGDKVLVSWMGGEPLLWPPLKALTLSFHDDYGLSVGATTNGTTLASPSVRAHLMEYYTELTISVDGIGPFHDQIRGWPDGYNTLRQSLTALALEKQRAGSGPHLRANIVIMRDNLEQFGRLCSELVDWGVEEITFNQLGGNDRPEYYTEHRLLTGQADWLARELKPLRERLATRGMRLYGGAEYLRRICATTRGERIPIRDCHPRGEFLFVDERGSIAPCNFTVSDYGVPSDRISSAEALQEIQTRFAEMHDQHRAPSCEDCHCTQVFEKYKM